MKSYHRVVLQMRSNKNAMSQTKSYQRVVLQTRKNQITALSTKLYSRVVLRLRTNQNAQLSMNLYWRTVPRKITNHVLQRKINQNAPMKNKKTQRMRLHMMWRIILTTSTYLNVEDIFWKDWTCRMKERARRSNQQSAILDTSILRNRLTPKENWRNRLTP